jgi:hypothetical protein
MSTLNRFLIVVVVALVLAAGLCVLDDDHAGIDLCLMALTVTLQTWALVSLTPMGRVVPCAIPHVASIPQRPLRPPI